MGFNYKKNIGKGFKMKNTSPFRMGLSDKDSDMDVYHDNVKEQTPEVRNIDYFNNPAMSEYKAHVANTPQFKEGSGVTGYLSTLGKRFVHNITGPSNPNLTTGGGAMDLIGGKGAVKFLSRGYNNLIIKQAIKKGIGKVTN